ncbi:MAG: transposase [Methylococcaceae bacterium]
MSDPLHCLWTLAPGDANYLMRWGQIKGRFPRHIDTGESLSNSRNKRRERKLRQRRFWTHLIMDQDDFNRHVDYIHWNPVKHGWVCQVADWPHSSFFKFVKMGVYPMTWGHSGEFDFDAGE